MTPSNQTDCLQWFTRFSDELCFLMQFGTTFSENLTRNSTLTKVQLKNCHWTQWMWREKCSNKHWTFWIGCGKQFWAFWFVSHDEKVNGQILFGETMPRQKCWWALTKCAMSKENVALQGTDGCISQLIVFWSSLSHQKVISQSGMKAWNCLPKPEKENHVGGIPTTQMWCGTSSNQPVPFHHKMTETLTPKTFALWGNVWSIAKDFFIRCQSNKIRMTFHIFDFKMTNGMSWPLPPHHAVVLGVKCQLLSSSIHWCPLQSITVNHSTWMKVNDGNMDSCSAVMMFENSCSSSIAQGMQNWINGCDDAWQRPSEVHHIWHKIKLCMSVGLWRHNQCS